MITVGELIEKLSRFDSDLPVTLSSDEEGNRLSYLYGVGSQFYYEEYGDLHCVATEDLEDVDNYFSVVELW